MLLCASCVAFERHQASIHKCIWLWHRPRNQFQTPPLVRFFVLIFFNAQNDMKGTAIAALEALLDVSDRLPLTDKCTVLESLLSHYGQLR